MLKEIIKKYQFKKAYFKYANIYKEELRKYLLGVEKRENIMFLNPQKYLKTFYKNTNGDLEKVKSFFKDLKNPLAELDGVMETRGLYITCFDKYNNNLTVGKRYKKIKIGTNWYIGHGVATYTVENDLGIKEEIPFYYFINF